MDQKDQDCTHLLRRIEEEINSVSLSDREAWQQLAAEIEEAVAQLPDDQETRTVLRLCAQGIGALSGKNAADPLSLIDALSQALLAVAQFLSGVADGDRAVQEAGTVLTGLVGEAGAQEIPRPCGQASLDDAAALLIQLEPDNREGLARLRESLQGIIAEKQHPQAILRLVSQAEETLGRLIEGDAADPEAGLSEVGKLLETAMNAEARPDGGEAPVVVAAAVPPAKGEAAPEETDYMPANADMDLLGEYINENNDLISGAEEALLSLETDPDDKEAVATVFRAFHTIKGTSAFLELAIISEMAHHAESLLSRVRDGEIRYSGGYADLSLRSIDMLKVLIRSVQEALGGTPLRKPKGYDELMLLLENPEKAGISAESDEAPSFAPRVGDILVAQGRVEREQVEEVAASQSEKPLGVELMKTSAASVKDVAHALRAQQQAKTTAPTVDTSVRVRTDRLDKLIDMVGEMVIAYSMIAQDSTSKEDGAHEFQKKIAHASKIVRELQDLSMSMRMVPLKPTFQKMTRLTRDLTARCGKQITFLTEGEDTEIDRNMVDLINDPLMHMVRNSVDHGVESPEDREKRGKPRNGTVKLAAYHSAGNVVVEIRDNGRGLDREAILKKAKARGLISEGSSLAERDVFNMIFEPGFSTAEKVTDVSGRGVGLDVVKRNIEALRGKIEIHSEVGEGCTFRILVPLTLAIIDGMVIRAGTERYIIPTISIVRSLQPKAEHLSTVLKRGEMLQLQGRLIPLFRLASLFSIEGAERDATKALVVVVEENGRQVGIVADELLGQQQTVIKSLGDAMQGLPGISGGAIMTDGRVGLILDVGGLVRVASSGRGEESGEG
jgi:two-component system, chemotaxis family, sensor kinase CheA